MPGTWRLEGGIGRQESRQKVGQVQLKFSGRVICHGVEGDGMIEHGRGDAEFPVHQGPNPEEVRHHRVDGGGFMEVPGNSRSVVAPSEWSAPSRTGAYEGEGGLLQDKGGQFEVGIRDAPMRIVKTEDVCSNILWPG